MARVAIVTGGTRGIGEAISLALKDHGMTVAATYAGNDDRAREFTERTGLPVTAIAAALDAAASAYGGGGAPPTQARRGPGAASAAGAESPGGFVHQQIRGVFRYART